VSELEVSVAELERHVDALQRELEAGEGSVARLQVVEDATRLDRRRAYRRQT
jgi:hypothetical protein